jgi:hypothetical protein
MTTLSRRISSLLGTLALTGVLAACASAADPDPAKAQANSEALACQSAGIHVEGCPIVVTKPPAPTCPAVTACGATPPEGTPGVYDPLVIVGADGGVQKDVGFATLLASSGCTPERLYYGTGSWGWATALCPASIASEVTAIGEANDGAAGVIACNSCTGTPDRAQVVVAWLIREGFAPVCVPNGTGSTWCTIPGGGCKTVSCLTY